MRFALLTSIAAAFALAACDAGAAEDAASEAAPVAEAAPAISTIDAVQLENLLKDSEIRLIDVRRDDEVADGIIPGAEHIALDSFDPATLDMSDGRDVVLYCRSGRRSAIAAERLAEHTGEPVRHLEGGITAWIEAGKPTITK